MIYNELRQRGTEDFPIELYSVNKSHPRFEMDFHWHSDFEFIRVLEGELYIRLDNNEYTAEKGTVIFINPETVHGANPIGDCVYECVVMHTDLFSETNSDCRYFVEELLSRKYAISEINSDKNSPFNISVNTLFDSLKEKKPGYRFTVIGALYNFLGAVLDGKLYTSLDASVSADKNHPKLKKVLDYIKENYQFPITLEDMAKHSSMSPKYFCSYFRSMTQKTPVEYLISYRIQQASKELLNTDNSVTDIALSCGFNDLSYFIKTFKLAKGITPAKYRKMHFSKINEPE